MLDLIVTLPYWLIKNVLWVSPLPVVIYCAYKEGYKKSFLLLLCMILPASFCWLKQWDLAIFLEQFSVFALTGLLLILDTMLLKHTKNNQKNDQNQSRDDQKKTGTVSVKPKEQ